MDKKLKVAVVGLKVGKLHLSDYKDNGDIGEICICTRNKDTLNEVGDEFSVEKRYTDVDELLSKEDLDAISITTPNETHFSLVLKALKKEVNVLVEKPFTVNAKQAEILKNYADSHHKVVMINYNKRYERAVYSLKRRIDSGEFGKINRIDVKWMRKRGIPWWFPLEDGKKHIGGGPVIDLGVHIIDVAMFLANDFEPKYITANSAYGIGASLAESRNITNYNVEDTGAAFIVLKNGTVISVETSWAYNGDKDVFEISVFGQNKSAKICDEGNFVFRPNGEDVEKTELVLENDVPNVRKLFIDAVLRKIEPQCTPKEGLATMKIIDAFYKSAERRKPVKIK